MKVSKSAIQLRDHLSSFSPEYAPWLRRPTADKSLDLPKYRSESWKYTNPDSLLKTQIKPHRVSELDINGAVNVYNFEDVAARKQVQDRLGQLTAKLSLAELNATLLDHGVIIESTTSAGTVEISSLPGNFQRLIVVANADLEIIETAPSNNRVVECWVNTQACLHYRRMQGESDGCEYNGFAAHVEAGGKLYLEQYSRGSMLRRNEFDIVLNGQSSEAHITGAWHLSEAQHIDNQVSVRHIKPGGLSRQHMRSYVTDNAKSVFCGKIHIAKGADGSDATLNNRNLIESTSAEVYTKPELEIYAQDVTCSHGATVGEIDEDAVFFLRSRGIPEKTARQLLVRGFLSAAIEHPEGREFLGLA